ncbi:MAG: PAS domain S-box protein [Candidatus Thermoplasmatota archaeon]
MNNLEELEERKKIHSDKGEGFLVLTLQEDGCLVYYNELFEKLFDFANDEKIDMSMEEIVPEYFLSKWESTFQEAKKGEHIADLILPLTSKNGEEIMVSWDIAPVLSNENKSAKFGLIGKPYVQDDLFKTPQEKNFVKEIDKLLASKNIKNQAEDEKSSYSKGTELNFDEIQKKYSKNKVIEKYHDIEKYINSYRKLKNENEKLKTEKEELLTLKDEFEKQNITDKIGEYFRNKFSFLYNVMNIEQRREELVNIRKESRNRLKQLHKIQKKINQDKKEINNTRKELVDWRKNLEVLEEEIELRKNIFTSYVQKIRNHYPLKENGQEEGSLLSNVEYLDENPEKIIEDMDASAAILQRGICKKVNDSFIKLIGRNTDQILDTSFFNFIAPDSLSEIEQYYLKRLKGEEIPNYTTNIMLNDEKELKVNIDFKPVIYKGNISEMVVIKTDEKKNQNKTKSEKLSEMKEKNTQDENPNKDREVVSESL